MKKTDVAAATSGANWMMLDFNDFNNDDFNNDDFIAYKKTDVATSGANWMMLDFNNDDFNNDDFNNDDFIAYKTGKQIYVQMGKQYMRLVLVKFLAKF